MEGIVRCGKVFRMNLTFNVTMPKAIPRSRSPLPLHERHISCFNSHIPLFEQKKIIFSPPSSFAVKENFCSKWEMSCAVYFKKGSSRPHKEPPVPYMREDGLQKSPAKRLPRKYHRNPRCNNAMTQARRRASQECTKVQFIFPASRIPSAEKSLTSLEGDQFDKNSKQPTFAYLIHDFLDR